MSAKNLTPHTAETLRAWRKSLPGKTSQPAAAKMLGISQNGYKQYENGVRPIPPGLVLATTALTFGFKLSVEHSGP